MVGRVLPADALVMHQLELARVDHRLAQPARRDDGDLALGDLRAALLVAVALEQRRKPGGTAAAMMA